MAGLSIQAEQPKLSLDYTNNRLVLSLTVSPECGWYLSENIGNFQDKKLTIDIKPQHNKRSLDANAYLWVLCDKIAAALNTTKEETYRELVRRVGQFEFIPIKAAATDTFIRMWNGRGLGWYAEVYEDSKLERYKKLIVYFGSSVYDSKGMNRLIDEAISEAKELGIPTLPPLELERIKEKHAKKQESKSL